MNQDFRLEKLSPSTNGPDAGPLLLVILDGIGIRPGKKEGYTGNALDLAQAATIKKVLPARSSAQIQLRAHGTAVGMPSNQDMGNSEVGHNAMGAGRIFDQGAKLVQMAIADGTLFEGAAWMRLIGTRKKPGLALESKSPRSVHFIGLLSDGNVHSHIDHLIAMIEKCAEEGVARVYVHVLLDGRDVDKASAQLYVKRLEEKLQFIDPEGESYAIASGGGRMQITMDRYEADWSMVERGWKTHVAGKTRGFRSALEAIETLRAEGLANDRDLVDQDLPPFVIMKNHSDKISGEKKDDRTITNLEPLGPIKDDDVIIFYNFRGDRAIEISRAFTEKDFPAFERKPNVNVHYAGMMQYDGDRHIPPEYIINPPAIERTLSEYLARNGVAQYAIAETQKFGHVTYFWNGNNSEKFDKKLETWKEIPSENVSFDERPRMQADAVTDELIKAMRSRDFQFLRVNYANGDMVGHTGNLNAAIKAVEAVDENLARLIDVADEIGAMVIVTADHGNCDEMYAVDKNGTAIPDGKGSYKVKTSHTLNPVPFFLFGKGTEQYEVNPDVEDPGLANLAATILQLLNYEAPEDYEPAVIHKIKKT